MDEKREIIDELQDVLASLNSLLYRATKEGMGPVVNAYHDGPRLKVEVKVRV